MFYYTSQIFNILCNQDSMRNRPHIHSAFLRDLHSEHPWKLLLYNSTQSSPLYFQKTVFIMERFSVIIWKRILVMSFFIFAVCLLYYPLIVFFCSQAGIRIRDSSVKGRRDNHFSVHYQLCYYPIWIIFLCSEAWFIPLRVVWERVLFSKKIGDIY